MSIISAKKEYRNENNEGISFYLDQLPMELIGERILFVNKLKNPCCGKTHVAILEGGIKKAFCERTESIVEEGKDFVEVFLQTGSYCWHEKDIEKARSLAVSLHNELEEIDKCEIFLDQGSFKFYKK